MALVRLTLVALLFATAQTAAAGSTTEDQFVLLTSGRVLAGQVTQNAQGFLVSSGTGSIQVSYEQARFVSDSMDQLYRQLRNEQPEPTADERLQLARWCISYGMYDQARIELKHALRDEPDREDLRLQLKRLAELIKPSKGEDKPRTFRSSDGYVIPQVESLGSLSRESAETFSARVQPLLINKCGNARCHGTAADNSFKLYHVSSGQNSHRLYTERNLAAVQAFLDLERPTESPLLTLPRGNHGTVGTIFGGSAGAKQLEVLEIWVKKVALDRRGQDLEPEVLAQAPQAKPIPTATPGTNARTSSGSIELTSATIRSDLEHDEPPPPHRDPFDPARFNELMHGGVSPRPTR